MTQRSLTRRARTDLERSDSAPGLPPEVAFELLGNRRRWYVLQYLWGHSRLVETGDLAIQIAAWENDVSVEEVTPQQRKRVYNSLQQHHLPRLAEHDVIEYESTRRTVELVEDPPPLGPYLHTDDDLTLSVPLLLSGCFAVGVVLGVVLGHIGAVPVISDPALAGSVVAVGVLALGVAARWAHLGADSPFHADDTDR